MNDKIEYLKQFAEKLDCVFVDKGEVGFGRPCVGILKKEVEHYLDINPFDYEIEHTLEDYSDCYIFGCDERLSANYETVPDAYHKHSCTAVLVHGDDYEAAINQLYIWMSGIEAHGEVEVKKHSFIDMDSLGEIEKIFSVPYKPALVIKQ